MSGSVWFTSDTHFEHRNVATRRGFADSAQHDETLIALWNAKVKPRDTVWHLGDVGRGGGGAAQEDATLASVGRLHGTIHLIAGNHDEVHPLHRDSHRHQRRWLEVFASVQPFARRRIEKSELLLSHFPYTGDHGMVDRHTQYRLRDEGLPLVHGHLHGDRPHTDRMVDVGVDVWGYAPVAYEDVIRLLF